MQINNQTNAYAYWLLTLLFALPGLFGIEFISLEALIFPIFVRAFIILGINNAMQGRFVRSIPALVFGMVVVFLLLATYLHISLSLVDIVILMFLSFLGLLNYNFDDSVINKKQITNFELFDILVLILLFVLVGDYAFLKFFSFVYILVLIVLFAVLSYSTYSKLSLVGISSNLLILSALVASFVLTLLFIVFSDLSKLFAISYISVSNLFILKFRT